MKATESKIKLECDGECDNCEYAAGCPVIIEDMIPKRKCNGKLLFTIILLLIVGVILFLSSCCSAQVGINTTRPEAALDIVSDTSGVLIPRLNTSEVEAMTPHQGELIYNLDFGCFWFYTGYDWQSLCENLSPEYSHEYTAISIPQVSNNEYFDYIWIVPYVFPGDGLTLSWEDDMNSNNSNLIAQALCFQQGEVTIRVSNINNHKNCPITTMFHLYIFEQ